MHIEQWLTTLFCPVGHDGKFLSSTQHPSSSPKEIQLNDNNSLNASEGSDVNHSSWLTRSAWSCGAFLINIYTEKLSWKNVFLARCSKKLLNCDIKRREKCSPSFFLHNFSNLRQLWTAKGFFNYLVFRLSTLNLTVLYVAAFSPLAILGVGRKSVCVCVCAAAP